jgi:cytochrome P450
MLALAEHPAERERIVRDPTRVPQLVEEALRFDSPVQLLMRVATRDTAVDGVAIPARSLVMVLLGAANRDADRFPEPDRFDPGREAAGHLAFGLGNHFCLGASLARLEGRIALETLLSRLPGFRIDAPRVERHGSFLVRGPKALPLRWSAA